MNAPNPPDFDPLDAAVAAFREMPVPPCPADNDWVDRMVADRSLVPNLRSPSRRSLMMRVALLSAAAVLATVTVVFLLAAPRSIALADVIRAAEEHRLVKYKKIQHNQYKHNLEVAPQLRVDYADLRRPRYRSVYHNPNSLNGAIDHETVFIIDGTKGVQSRRTTTKVSERGRTETQAIEQLKFYEQAGGKVPRQEMEQWDIKSDGRVDATPATTNQAKSILENLRDLETHKDLVATRGKLGAADALKFRVDDGQRSTVLWVDPATRLPLRLEYDTTDPADLHPTNNWTKYILTDFEWDPQLDGFRDLDDLFKTDPTPGYQVEDHRSEASTDKK